MPPELGSALPAAQSRIRLAPKTMSQLKEGRVADYRGIISKISQAAVCAAFIGYSPAASADSFSGGYLAGKQALFSGDFAAATRYIERTIAYDPGNIVLLERAVIVNLSMGNIDRAAEIADLLDTQGAVSTIAQIAQTTRDVKAENYAAVSLAIADGQGLGPYADDLAAAWSRLGQGDMSDALVAFDEASQKETVNLFVPFHKAMALASVGDYESADAIFEAEAPGSLAYTRRGLIAWSEILSHLGRNEEALAVIDENFGPRLDPELQKLRADLEAGETLPFTVIRSPRDGIAEVFFSIADVFEGRDQDDLMLIYAQMAAYLRDDFVAAHLITGQLLENMQQYDLALAAYGKVQPEDLSFHSAELGRVSALRALGRIDEAQAILDQLSETHADLPVVHYTRGDFLRRNEQFEGCADAYTKALNLYGSEEERNWFLFYARGICHERTGEWADAEADFRQALEMNPEQPQVLNYLGYSLVEQERKLDEALDMIERALAAAPNSGAITDSLGWALFRLGRYEEAVAPMERAAELLSVDPVINDHLGDVYWAVGRKLEAEFMWRRALSFVDWDGASEQIEADRIRRKIEVGLDIVLNEEGADPLVSQTLVSDSN